MRGRTTLAIAHRLSTIRHADRILVLADGRLAESGDHDSLIALGGIYFNLYRLQYEGEAESRL
jgi:ABC-type multidrug transport system fused ATPase/permease subunit